MASFLKERQRALPGSIPYVLGMFQSEVRFYREIASVVGVRVPECFAAEVTEAGTRMELEDLSAWAAGADPIEVASQLRELHERWQSAAIEHWPWLRRAGAAADEIGDLYDRTWAMFAAHASLPQGVRDLGERLVGRIAEAERAEATLVPHTLVHGDASTANLRTGPRGEIAFLDWEDVRYGPGVSDLAWLLVSSVAPELWDEVIAAYGGAPDLAVAIPAAAGQGILCFSAVPADSAAAGRWVPRLVCAASRLS